MAKSLSFRTEPVPARALAASGSASGAVISVLAMIAMSPVSLALNRGVNGVMTARSVRRSSASAPAGRTD